MKTYVTDQNLIDLVRQGDRLTLRYIYKKYQRLVHRYVISHNGNLQDAQDIYQEVMLAFYMNALAGKLSYLHGKLSTYLHKIAQNCWHSRLRIHEPIKGALNLTDYPIEQSTNIAGEDALLEQLINALDERCRLILKLYYFNELSMKEVAAWVGLSGAESARKHKCNCLAKLRTLASEYPFDNPSL